MSPAKLKQKVSAFNKHTRLIHNQSEISRPRETLEHQSISISTCSITFLCCLQDNPGGSAERLHRPPPWFTLRAMSGQDLGSGGSCPISYLHIGLRLMKSLTPRAVIAKVWGSPQQILLDTFIDLSSLKCTLAPLDKGRILHGKWFYFVSLMKHLWNINLTVIKLLFGSWAVISINMQDAHAAYSF